jgi:acyl carrier protein
LARQDESSGCFIIEGRIKNACNISGYLVRPEEITEALMNLAGIADAVCFGVADERTEERIVAAVVITSGHPWSQLDMPGLQLEIASALRHDLEAYKVPAAVQVWPSLPRGDSGKVPIPAVQAAWSDGSHAVQTEGSQAQMANLSAQIIACAKDALRNADVHAGSDSTNTIGWDSMAHLDLIQRIESQFCVQFTVSETMRANAISTLETILRDKLS